MRHLAKNGEKALRGESWDRGIGAAYQYDIAEYQKLREEDELFCEGKVERWKGQSSDVQCKEKGH